MSRIEGYWHGEDLAATGRHMKCIGLKLNWKKQHTCGSSRLNSGRHYLLQVDQWTYEGWLQGASRNS